MKMYSERERANMINNNSLHLCFLHNRREHKKIYDIALNRVAVFVVVLIIFLIANAGYAYKLQGCGAECKTCHKLKDNEAEEIIKQFNAHVVKMESSPIKGLWMVKVAQAGKEFPIYIHYSKKYVFSGDIIDVASKKKIVEGNESNEQPAGKVDFNSIPFKDAPVIGNSSAKNKVIVFTDPDCSFCRLLHKEMKKVVAVRKDIAFYLKFFPLPMHAFAYKKSKTIVCEKSSKLLDDAFNGKEIPSPKCETTAIDDNIRLANTMGINSTPTIIFKDDSIVPGYKDAESLIKLIDSAK